MFFYIDVFGFPTTVGTEGHLMLAKVERFPPDNGSFIVLAILGNSADIAQLRFLDMMEYPMAVVLIEWQKERSELLFAGDATP